MLLFRESFSSLRSTTIHRNHTVCCLFPIADTVATLGTLVAGQSSRYPVSSPPTHPNPSYHTPCTIHSRPTATHSKTPHATVAHDGHWAPSVYNTHVHWHPDRHYTSNNLYRVYPSHGHRNDWRNSTRDMCYMAHKRCSRWPYRLRLDTFRSDTRYNQHKPCLRARCREPWRIGCVLDKWNTCDRRGPPQSCSWRRCTYWRDTSNNLHKNTKKASDG